MPSPESRPISSPLALTDLALRAIVSTYRGFDAGAAYQRSGRAHIKSERIEDVGLIIHAIVEGSRARPYTQTIMLAQRTNGAVTIAGHCTCPMQKDCKHVVAALLQWREEARAKSPPRPPQPGGGVASARAPAHPNPAPEAQLPLDVREWLDDLSGALARSDHYPPEIRQRLFYVLDRGPHGAGVIVRTVSVRLDKQGHPTGASSLYNPANALNRSPAKFLRDADLAILARLGTMRPFAAGGEGALVKGAPGAVILQDILSTGRAVWKALDGRALTKGPPRTARGDWIEQTDGAQRFAFIFENGERAQTLALAPPYYVDVITGAVGVIESALGDATAAALAAAPDIAAAHAIVAIDKLKSLAHGDALPLPRAMALSEDLRAKPKPLARLAMTKIAIAVADASWAMRAIYERATPTLEVSFAYEHAAFPLNDPAAFVTRLVDGHVRRIIRDRTQERDLSQRLFGLGLRPLGDLERLRPTLAQRSLLAFSPNDAPEDWIDFLLDERPALEREGWTIEIDSDFPLKLAEADASPWQFYADAAKRERSGVDWFDLELGVVVDDVEIDILPALLGLLKRLPAGAERESLTKLAHGKAERGRVIVSLPDGRALPLPITRVAPILEALLAVWAPSDIDEGPVRLSTRRVGDLALLHDDLGGHVSFIGAKRALDLAGELTNWSTRAPTPTPSWFTANLRSYQQAGLDWFQMLARTGFGGVLADDMGLGKTVQALAHLSVERQASRPRAPALVVAPTSVLGNWRAETERFAPKLKTLLLHGPERKRDFPRIKTADLVITSYPLLARDGEVLAKTNWSLVILDEAQTIRNPTTSFAQAAFALKARQRLALSGTPVENHLGDVWSLMQFLNPGLLGDARSFAKRFRTPIEKHDDAFAKQQLNRRLKPFLLRRTKDFVAKDLPAKTQIVERVELNPGQRRLYDATRLAMAKKVREALHARGLAKSAIIILDALLKLRQVCCDPRLVRTASERDKAGGSAKLDRLLELVEELNEEGRTALVFSQFTSMLDLISAALDARKRPYAWLTGDTKDRATPVRAFQNGEVDLFLLSLKAGGVGLNLTRADTVILYDPWWNPAVEAQAIDRAHRIGRNKPVFIHRLIAEATIEEKMVALQNKKKGLADALWDGDAEGFGALSTEDVLGLFD